MFRAQTTLLWSSNLTFIQLFYDLFQIFAIFLFFFFFAQVARKLVILEGELERAEERAELAEW